MARIPKTVDVTVRVTDIIWPGEVIHMCPPDGSGLTPCCGRTPFELPSYHRLTGDPNLVSCEDRERRGA